MRDDCGHPFLFFCVIERCLTFVFAQTDEMEIKEQDLYDPALLFILKDETHVVF